MNQPTHFILVASTLFLACVASPHAAAQSTLPQGHPAVSTPEPKMPTGHPETTEPPEIIDALSGLPSANLEDVASINAIVNAYYDSISGPKGKARDWGRFRSLFLPTATLSTRRPTPEGSTIMTISAEEFVKMNLTYFERGGYYETQVNERHESYGSIAQVFSTYQSRRRSMAAQPYLTGINAFQLCNDGERWWIVSMVWDHQRPDSPLIDARYLPEASAP